MRTRRRSASLALSAALALTMTACWPNLPAPPAYTPCKPNCTTTTTGDREPVCYRFPGGCDTQDPAPDEPVSCEDHPEPYEGDLPCGFVDGIPVGADG